MCTVRHTNTTGPHARCRVQVICFCDDVPHVALTSFSFLSKECPNNFVPRSAHFMNLTNRYEASGFVWKKLTEAA